MYPSTRWKDGQMDGRMDIGQTDGQMDQMDGWMDRRTDG